MTKPLKITYLFSTFPVATETFLQREVRAMIKLPVELNLFSLWGGDKSYKGLKVFRFAKWKLILLILLFPYWMCRKPKAFRDIFSGLWQRSMPSLGNAGEVFIGLSFAILYAGRFSRQRPSHFHATWATMPATAAMLLSKLTGIPFSMGAHAFDIYAHGGDWLLPEKLVAAAFVHTTTEAAARHLIERGADKNDIAVIRRGLDYYPELKTEHAVGQPLRIVSVGRLVEKKDQLRQIEIYVELLKQGIAFKARIIGSGPMENTLRAKIKELDLLANVELMGYIDNEAVFEQYRWADIFLYTTKVATDGNRDGTPNVILEAMAAGLPIIAAIHPGISEVITSGENGLIIEQSESEAWIEAITGLIKNNELYNKIRMNGRHWVEENADAHKNTTRLYQKFKNAANA